LTATEISQLNAYRKARAVAKKFPDALVLGADTLVYLGTTLFGKPADLAEAFEMLKQLQGRQHEVITGVCLVQLRGHHQAMFAESTKVRFHALRAKDIRNYLAHIDPLDKAGAYAIQEHGGRIVQSVSGSISNVIGLPLERLSEELKRWSEPVATGGGS
jgi:septum formation protein